MYAINPACVDCFPSAADIVMGRRAPQPPLVYGQRGRDREGPQP